MVRCAHCGFYTWIDMLGIIKEAAKCYHQGRRVEHDWRYKTGEVYLPPAKEAQREHD